MVDFPLSVIRLLIKIMSRVGKKPIEILSGVEVRIEGQKVIVKGPKGELIREVRPEIKVETNGKEVVFSEAKETQETNAFWGMERALVQNMIIGVSRGFEKQLEISGVGFNANIKGNKIELNVGFSHKVEVDIPAGIEVSVKGKNITVSGCDKNLVGLVAEKIKKVRPPDPYHGKGIKYAGEVIKLKPGKKAAAA